MYFIELGTYRDGVGIITEGRVVDYDLMKIQLRYYIDLWDYSRLYYYGALLTLFIFNEVKIDLVNPYIGVVDYIKISKTSISNKI